MIRGTKFSLMPGYSAIWTKVDLQFYCQKMLWNVMFFGKMEDGSYDFQKT